MITTENYFSELSKVTPDTFPETLRKSHDFVVKTTGNGSQWNTYHSNATIKKVIDLYFIKLNDYLESNKIAPSLEVQTKPSPSSPKSKPYPVSQSNTHPPLKTQSPEKRKSIRKGREKPKAVKKVEHLREEIKFIKRFVGLHNKTRSPETILAFIKSLQRAIVQKHIRKGSPLAREIQSIQDKLVNTYNNTSDHVKFVINDTDLARLVHIAGGEQVYPSINIIKRYIGLQGKKLTIQQIETFTKQIQKALGTKRVAEDDPYLDKVRTILNSIKKLTTDRAVTIAKTELNGLAGIVNTCQCKKASLGRIYHTGGKKLRPCKKRTYSDARKGACSHNKGLNGVLTAEEMANRQFEVLPFTNGWLVLLGTPARNFTLMIHGEPGAGKTTFLLKFCKYLAETFGTVIYISSEEYAASTLTEKINELLNPFPHNLHFAEKLSNVNLGDYDFVVLDSVNDLGLSLHDYKVLRKSNPNTAFILVLQHTKDGSYRGGKDWEHELEIAGQVENGTITIYRSRYGVKGATNFFDTPMQTNYSTIKTI